MGRKALVGMRAGRHLSRPLGGATGDRRQETGDRRQNTGDGREERDEKEMRKKEINKRGSISYNTSYKKNTFLMMLFRYIFTILKSLRRRLKLSDGASWMLHTHPNGEH